MATLLIQAAVAVGGYFLQQLLAPRQKIEGPRLDDLNVPYVSPGNPIPYHWGSMKLNGQRIWNTDLKETKTVKKSGGKGSKKPKTKTTTYTYSADVAVLVCEGPVYRIRRIWANQKLFYDSNQGITYVPPSGDEEEKDLPTDLSGSWDSAITEQEGTGSAGGVDRGTALGIVITGNKKTQCNALRIYYGTEEQLPDPVMEAALGVGNVPAHRGECYFTIDDMQLKNFGNGIPAFTIEVQKKPGGTTYLYEVLGDICQRCGMAEDQYDHISEMDRTVKVKGYVLNNSTTGRDAIQMLQNAHPFDGAEIGYKVRFRWREQLPVALLSRGDFGTKETDTEEVPPSEEVTIAQELELPREVNVKFQDYNRQYSPNTGRATRVETKSNEVVDLDLPMAMSTSDGKNVAEDILNLRILERRTYKVILPVKYVILEPGDIVAVPDKWNTNFVNYYRLKSTSLGANNVIEAVFTDYDKTLRGTAFTSDATRDGPGMAEYGDILVFMLDIPLLTDDEDDLPGFYVAFGCTQDIWGGGAVVVNDASSGSSPVFGGATGGGSTTTRWETLLSSNDFTATGKTINALGPGNEYLFDRDSVLEVELDNEAVELTSYTEDELITTRNNFAVVGNEIIQFGNVEYITNTRVRLSLLRRGIRGTNNFMSGHVVNERFVYLNGPEGSVQRFNHSATLLGISKEFRAVNAEDAVQDATSFYSTNTGNSLRPYSPVFRHPEREADGALVISWDGRLRQDGEWVNGVNDLKDQPTDNWEVEILNAAGTAVVRVQPVANTHTWTYSAAQQITDFGSVQSKIKVNLYQTSPIIGRGFKAEAEL